MRPPGNAEAALQFLAIVGTSCAFVLALFAADFVIVLGAELLSQLRHRRALRQCRRVDRSLRSDGGA